MEIAGGLTLQIFGRESGLSRRYRRGSGLHFLARADGGEIWRRRFLEAGGFSRAGRAQVCGGWMGRSWLRCTRRIFACVFDYGRAGGNGLRHFASGLRAFGGQIYSPVSGLAIGEFDLNVVLGGGVAADLHDAADRILARLYVGQHNCLARADRRAHLQNSAAGKHNHRGGLLFKRLRLRIRAIEWARQGGAVHSHRHFERERVGAKMRGRLS